MDMPEPDVHAHDRRPGQGDARLPAADRRGDRRRVRRRGRHHGDGHRPAPGHRAQQGRVPVRARRPRRLRHGRLRDAAADHRTGPRGGPALHRPGRWAARRRSAGASTTASCEPDAAGRARRAGADLADGPTFAPRDDQDDAAPGVEHGIEQAIEAEAQAQAICMQTQDFERAYHAFAAKRSRCSRETEWPTHVPGLAVLRRRATARRGALDERWAAEHVPRRGGETTTLDATRAAPLVGRARPRPAGCACGARRLRGGGRRSTCARSASRARRSAARPAWPTSRSRCRAWAPAPITLFGTPAQARAPAGAWPPARRSRRSRSPSPTPAPTCRDADDGAA